MRIQNLEGDADEVEIINRLVDTVNDLQQRLEELEGIVSRIPRDYSSDWQF